MISRKTREKLMRMVNSKDKFKLVYALSKIGYEQEGIKDESMPKRNWTRPRP